MRTIRVTGKGQMKVHPDMTRITISLEGYGWEYGETLEEASAYTEKMRCIEKRTGSVHVYPESGCSPRGTRALVCRDSF